MRGPDSAIPPRGIGVWPSRQPQVGRGPRLVFCIDYRYDLCGNRVLRMRQPAEDGRESATTYYDTNELNQLTRTANVERDEFLETYLTATTYFSYDMNGNTVARLTTDEEGLLTGATYYDWDAESQLTGVRYLAGLDNAFAYDGRYQRVEKQQAAGTVRYNWDGLNVLLERDGEDEPLATHTHGPVPIAGIGTHLTTRKHGETPEDLWYHHDAIGSTRQLSDETQPPALTRQNLLDAWGNLLATAGTQDTPYRFTGKETDEDTGLIYFGRRFFDPAMGRWLNRDPARDGQNWYEYAASNPMARVDAEGLQNIDPFVPDDVVTEMAKPRQPRSPQAEKEQRLRDQQLRQQRLREQELREQLRQDLQTRGLEIINYLKTHPRHGREANLERCKLIAELMRIMARWGRDIEHYRFCPEFLEGWLEGTGQPHNITFHDLLQDPVFEWSYQDLWGDIRKQVHAGQDHSHPYSKSRVFSSIDLFATFHKWETLEPVATISYEKEWRADGHLYKKATIRVDWTFSDTYDWSPGEATHIPGSTLTVNQDWFIELRDSVPQLGSRWHGPRPRDYVTTITLSETRHTDWFMAR